MSRKKKDKTKRNIILQGLDKKLELSKVVEIKVENKEFVYFDKLPDGTWRMAYTSPTISDIKELEAFIIERVN